MIDKEKISEEITDMHRNVKNRRIKIIRANEELAAINAALARHEEDAVVQKNNLQTIVKNDLVPIKEYVTVLEQYETSKNAIKDLKRQALIKSTLVNTVLKEIDLIENRIKSLDISMLTAADNLLRF